MKKKKKPYLRDQKFLLTTLVISCCTILTALGKIEGKDYQAIVLMILTGYASAKAIFKSRD